eukprot:GSChrysophyteH1.ASY1.ANO1.295.1 assembled CDS
MSNDPASPYAGKLRNSTRAKQSESTCVAALVEDKPNQPLCILYTAPNTPIASAKRPRTKKDMHSPSAIRTTSRIDLKHKSKVPNKALFTSPQGTAATAVNVSAEATCEEIAQKAEDEMAAAHEQEQEADESVFNPYLFMAELPPLDSIERNNVLLPPKERDMEGKPTLVLDLDETLVHCTVEAIDKPDLTFPVMFNGVLYDVYVRKRPYLDYFLEHRLFREACVFVNGNYLKDLHVCGREYHQMALVDNSPHAYSYQIENGIPIESWFDDDTDTELLKLVGFLRRCFSEGDVRPIIENQFKTHELIVRASKGLHVDLSAPAL